MNVAATSRQVDVTTIAARRRALAQPVGRRAPRLCDRRGRCEDGGVHALAAGLAAVFASE